MTEAAAEAEAAAAEAAAAEAAVKEEEHEKLPEEVTESVVEVCQELTVLSNNHNNRTTGQYFNVNIDCIEYLTGSTFSSPELQIKVTQRRAGTAIWTGTVIIWSSTNGGSIGDAHGRRVSGCAPGQWHIGDVIVLA